MTLQHGTTMGLILLGVFVAGCKGAGNATPTDPYVPPANVALAESAAASPQPGPAGSLTPRPAAPLGGQQYCPVTGAKLGSMGEPVPVDVGGRTVYVCCAGCVEKLRSNSQADAPPPQARRDVTPSYDSSTGGGGCSGGHCH